MPDFEALPREVRRKGMREALKILAKAVRREVPRSGRRSDKALYRRIRYRVQQGGLAGEVKPKAPHAHLVHEGTKEHPIYPKKSRFLRFSAGDRLIFARFLMHPGAKKNPFLDRALADNRDAALAELRKAAEAGREAIT